MIRMMYEDPRTPALDLESPSQILAADCPISPPEEVEKEATERDFEFAFSPSFSGENFADGRIRPFYPVFGRDFNDEELMSLTMEKLVIDDDDSAASSESEEPAPESYCEWSPRSPENYQKRSSSTGSAAARRPRWRLRDILAVGRSRSDGKERFQLVRAHDGDNKEHQTHKKESYTDPKADSRVKILPPAAKGLVTAHRAFYGNDKSKGEKARRSFLPYRPELIGIGLGPARPHIY